MSGCADFFDIVGRGDFSKSLSDSDEADDDDDAELSSDESSDSDSLELPVTKKANK